MQFQEMQHLSHRPLQSSGCRSLGTPSPFRTWLETSPPAMGHARQHCSFTAFKYSSNRGICRCFWSGDNTRPSTGLLGRAWGGHAIRTISKSQVHTAMTHRLHSMPLGKKLFDALQASCPTRTDHSSDHAVSMFWYQCGGVQGSGTS